MNYCCFLQLTVRVELADLACFISQEALRPKSDESLGKGRAVPQSLQIADDAGSAQVLVPNNSAFGEPMAQCHTKSLPHNHCVCFGEDKVEHGGTRHALSGREVAREPPLARRKHGMVRGQEQLAQAIHLHGTVTEHFHHTANFGSTLCSRNPVSLRRHGEHNRHLLVP